MKPTVLMLCALIASPSLAAEHSQRCVPLKAAEEASAEAHGTWIKLTTDQLQFLRGVSSMHPKTPVGIPLGDSAAMVTAQGQETSLIFFIDGDRACDAMPIPDVMKKLVMDIGSGVVKHEGEGL